MENKKVLIVTPGGSFFRDPHVRAFQRRGFECLLFDSRHGFVYTSAFRALARRMPVFNILKKRQVAKINMDLLHFVVEHRPRYLFAQKAETIHPETLEAIRNMGTVTINFFNDLMGEWPVISKIAPHYDYFFNQDRVVLRRLWHELGLKNCFYMAHAAEPLEDPFVGQERIYPISFVGTHAPHVYPNREKYLVAIQDLGLYIWGNDAWRGTPLGGVFQGRAIGDERLHIYRKSKIVIDINWEHFPSEGTSVRPFEVAGAGACLFVDLVKNDIKNVYQEGSEFVSFSSASELRAKVAYYLEHERERDMIARAGYARTVADHTYDRRLEHLFAIMRHPSDYLYT